MDKAKAIEKWLEEEKVLRDSLPLWLRIDADKRDANLPSKMKSEISRVYRLAADYLEATGKDVEKQKLRDRRCCEYCGDDLVLYCANCDSILTVDVPDNEPV